MAAPNSSCDLFVDVAAFVAEAVLGVVEGLEDEVGIREIRVGVGSAVADAAVECVVGFAFGVKVRLLVDEEAAGIEHSAFVFRFSGHGEGGECEGGIIGGETFYVDAAIGFLGAEEESEGFLDIGGHFCGDVAVRVVEEGGGGEGGEGGVGDISPGAGFFILLFGEPAVSSLDGSFDF